MVSTLIHTRMRISSLRSDVCDVTTLWCRPGSLLGGVLLFAPRSSTDDIKRFPDGILPSYSHYELFVLARCTGDVTLGADVVNLFVELSVPSGE